MNVLGDKDIMQVSPLSDVFHVEIHVKGVTLRKFVLQ